MARPARYTYPFLYIWLIIFGYVPLALFPQSGPAEGVRAEKDPNKQFGLLIDSCESLAQSNFRQSLQYARMAVSLSESLNDNRKKATAYYCLGYVFEASGENDSAYKCLDISRDFYRDVQDNEGLYRSTQRIASAYSANANYKMAYTYYKDLIGIAEKLNDKEKLARVYIGVGEMFRKLNDIEKCISYTNKALEVAQKSGFNNLAESCYLNLGIAYSDLKQIDPAVEYLNRALKLNDITNDRLKKAQELNTIGSIYFDLENYEKALGYFKQTLEIYRELNYISGFIMCNNNIGTSLMQLQKYNVAKPYLIEAYFAAKNNKGNVESLINSTYNLAQLYEATGDYKSALEYMDIYTTLNDSLYNVENSKNLAEIEAKYESEKKEQQNKLLLLSNEKKQMGIYYALGACLLLTGLFFLVYRSYRQKQKANIELAEKSSIIEEKSRIVEEQHKDITDSIKYAERIQKAILPPARLWRQILPRSFVFYQPKDILSGDFYWIAETAEHIFVAAADCTGHGVPGALISIVNYNLINKAVLEKNYTDPGMILDEVNRLLTQSLHQTYQESAVRDGMDISLCVINKRTRAMNYAGAYNSIYIVNRDTKELTELLADKQPVGAFIEDNLKSFTTKAYQLSSSDVVYMFTDGYADQFGGEKGKKFKYKNLQQLLKKICDHDFVMQQAEIEQTIYDWKNYYEQVDDMLLLGFNI